MVQPLFWDIDLTDFFRLLGQLFASVREIWSRFVINVGSYSFSFWDFIIFTLIFYILVMRFFFESDD